MRMLERRRLRAFALGLIAAWGIASMVDALAPQIGEIPFGASPTHARRGVAESKLALQP